MKIIKLSLTISLVLIIIGLGGAWLLPSKQYYSRQKEVRMDKVAVFEKLKNPDYFDIPSFFVPGKDTASVFLMVDTLIPYSSLKYKMKISDNDKLLITGFNLDETENGTKITWFIESDSLSFPIERWTGFYFISMKKGSINAGIEELSKEISK